MTVEIKLKPKYTVRSTGKVKTRTGGGNSTKKHPNKMQQGAGLRIEGELKKFAQQQTKDKRKVLIITSSGRRWLPQSVYDDLIRRNVSIDDYLRERNG